jgi:hypothetical protein
MAVALPAMKKIGVSLDGYIKEGDEKWSTRRQ